MTREATDTHNLLYSYALAEFWVRAFGCDWLIPDTRPWYRSTVSHRRTRCCSLRDAWHSSSPSSDAAARGSSPGACWSRLVQAIHCRILRVLKQVSNRITHRRPTWTFLSSTERKSVAIYLLCLVLFFFNFSNSCCTRYSLIAFLFSISAWWSSCSSLNSCWALWRSRSGRTLPEAWRRSCSTASRSTTISLGSPEHYQLCGTIYIRRLACLSCNITYSVFSAC